MNLYTEATMDNMDTLESKMKFSFTIALKLKLEQQPQTLSFMKKF